ncbi:hypothetical protein Ptr902_08064 [Pyrenophora tritici-repentis]|nr:hypothetical protein Ptr902_08064 [Pyrenophora tritici-repentis]
MKYLATIISLALALTPAALADVACCLAPGTNTRNAACTQADFEPACCSVKTFNSCANRGTYKWTYNRGDYATPTTTFPCTGGGFGRCVRKGKGIPP